MCTGDIVLYNDEPQRTWLGAAAEVLTRALAVLPCNTFVAAAWSERTQFDEEASSEPPLVERDWLHWRCATLVVRMLDETESNPNNDPTKQIPYVFCVHGEMDYPNLWPLKTLLSDVNARAAARGEHSTYFALRQLLTIGDRQQKTLSSNLRDSLRRQLLTFYTQTMAGFAQEVQLPMFRLRARWLAVARALDVEDGAPASATPGSVDQHRNALYRACPSYFALVSLHRINVLRCEPLVASAREALQEGGYVESQMHQNYSLGDEIVFFYTSARK